MRATDSMNTPTRADLLRQRRAEQSRGRNSHAHKPSTRAVHSKPVTMRNSIITR